MQQILSLVLVYAMLVQSCAGRSSSPSPTKTTPAATPNANSTASTTTTTTTPTLSAVGDPVEIICSQAVNGALTITPSMPTSWVFSARNSTGSIPITSIMGVNAMGQRPMSMIISGSNVSFTATSQYDYTGTVTVVAGNGAVTNQKMFSWGMNQNASMTSMMLPMMMMMIPNLLRGGTTGGILGGTTTGGILGGGSSGGGILGGGSTQSVASGGGGGGCANGQCGLNSGGATTSGGCANGQCGAGNRPATTNGSLVAQTPSKGATTSSSGGAAKVTPSTNAASGTNHVEPEL